MSFEEKNKIKDGMLYLVATPIGNLGDISHRVLKVLTQVSFIAAEDTRNTLRLLTHFGISKPLVSYFEHNKRERGEEIVARLVAGESCALVTDAGTPAVSDPGEDLVVLCAERGIEVTSVPGACAFVTALILSGLPTGRFSFEGFLPMNKTGRRERLEEFTRENRTFILYEAPHKLKKTLTDLRNTLGAERRIAICRELTKLNEEIMRTTIGDAAAHYAKAEPRGEYVLVIDGKQEGEVPQTKTDMIPEEICDAVALHMKNGMQKTDAVKRVSKDTGISRQEVYKISLEIKPEREIL